MSRLKFFLVALGLAGATSAFASPTGRSIAINFGADEPDGANQAYVEGAAGVAGTANWNNLTLLSGVSDEITMDVSGAPVGTSVEVEWMSNNTWSTDGRGEDNNNAPPGNDYNLMLGYLDTTDVSITEVFVDGLPEEVAGGFDVIVYTLGGVLGRGGTYTISDGTNEIAKDNVVSVLFDGSYIEGVDGNFLLFEGFSGTGFELRAQATTTALFRGPINGIEICAAGQCEPRPNPVAGRGTIGDQTVAAQQQNEVFGPLGDFSPGLAQEWFQATNPGNKTNIDAIFDTQDPVTSPFQASHGTTWWTGSVAAFAPLEKYPVEVQPPFNATNNDNYVVRATGEIFIPETGDYRFADGVDDYTYFAIDLDNSGVAGDDPIEVLIDDNSWTTPLRDGNGGGEGWNEIEIDVADGGQWLAVEFNMGEGGGGDSGVVYWDYDPDAPEGDRLGGGVGFPELTGDAILAEDAPSLIIPDTHLRSKVQALISADRVGSITSSVLGFEFEIDGDTDTADRLLIPNPNPDVYTTILDVDGVKFQLTATGDLQQGDSFQIIGADQILGTPSIISSDPNQTWTFNSATGFVTFGAGLRGDYNGNGTLDAEDLDLQAAVGLGLLPFEAKFDENNDGVVNELDRGIWLDDLKMTWVGDANLDFEFNTADFVQVFTEGKYETGETAGWAQGDWTGDLIFDTADFVAAFTANGYERGPYPGEGVAAVPEPSALVLSLFGVAGLLSLARRRRG